MCGKWAVEEAPKLIVNKRKRSLIYADNLAGQQAPDSFYRPLKKHCNTDVHAYVAGQTDEISAIDAGFGKLLKDEKREVQEEYLTNPEHPERWKEWSGGRITASRRRILLTHWYGKAHERACQKFDFLKVFQNVGHFLTVDGSDDDKLKLQGVKEFTFNASDADRDPKTGLLPSEDNVLDLTIQVAQAGAASKGKASKGEESKDTASKGQASKGAAGQDSGDDSDGSSDCESFSENGNSTTTEAGDTTDDEPDDCGAWNNTDDSEYYSDLPDWATQEEALVGSRVAQKFNDGWSKGVVQGVESNKRIPEFGQYFIKHKGDKYPFYDELSAEFYGAETCWVLLKKKGKLPAKRKGKKPASAKHAKPAAHAKPAEPAEPPSAAAKPAVPASPASPASSSGPAGAAENASFSEQCSFYPACFLPSRAPLPCKHPGCNLLSHHICEIQRCGDNSRGGSKYVPCREHCSNPINK